MSRFSGFSIFDSFQLEGNLFVPAILEKIARGEHTRQKLEDYQLPKGLKLTSEQGRSFQIALALWNDFEQKQNRTDLDLRKTTAGFLFSLLQDAFDYNDLDPTPKEIEIRGLGYRIDGFVRGRIPVFVAPSDLELDQPDERFAIVHSGSRRRSVHQLAQQFLNASDQHVWAIISNGRRLRLLRNADTLTRPAFLEFDLEQILHDEGRYSDFIASWRILHASRAGKPDASAADCIWEEWKNEGEEQGERVRDGLRGGVTRALLILGNGFLQHRENSNLRKKLDSGELPVDAYFQQLLRLIYRFLFLFTTEEAELLHPPAKTPEDHAARELYKNGYALRRLRERALRRSGFDRFSDQWAAIRIVFRSLQAGEPRLALPALGGLFSAEQTPDLDQANLENRALLETMLKLRWSAASGRLAPIDYRNIGAEEFGSVYESLLELIPTVDLRDRSFGFVGLTDEGTADGHARKMTGSYYTPDFLVKELLDSALDPVIEKRIAADPENPIQAILGISIIDPACGSGQFLLGAARRLAEKLAELRSEEGAVRPHDYRHALREVIANCIFGVDRNPLALELARTALWLEGYEPGEPLSFLDHHLRCGDALLGFTDLQQIKKGIPNGAFKQLSGDDREICNQLRATNRSALKALKNLVEDRNVQLFEESDLEKHLQGLKTIEEMPENTTEQIRQKEKAYRKFLEEAADTPLAIAADFVIAAVLSPKAEREDLERVPTTQMLLELLLPENEQEVSGKTVSYGRKIAREAQVFHWPLEFAQIFSRGGFDCVLGNPPWERIKLQEQEFFASRHPEIAQAPNQAARRRKIEKLNRDEANEAEKQLYRDFMKTRRLSEAISDFAHFSREEGGRFPRTGIGDVNTYALFAETIDQLVHREGRAGLIVPTGIATDNSTKDFFGSLVNSHRLVSLYDFENRQKIFPAIDSRIKFSLLTLGNAEEAEFAFFLLQPEELNDSRRYIRLSADDFRRINPNTLTCPVFRSKADAELTKKIYRNVPVLIEERRDNHPERNPWGILFSAMIHMSNDSQHFSDFEKEGMLRLYEAKMLHQFDHRWATYFVDEDGKPDSVEVSEEQKADPDYQVQPRYWVDEKLVLNRIARVPQSLKRAVNSEDPIEILKVLANWIISAGFDEQLYELNGNKVETDLIELGGNRFRELSENGIRWLDNKLIAEAWEFPPLSEEELEFLRSEEDLETVIYQIFDLRSPKWIMGWRDICRSTDQRTVIASVLPRAGSGDTFLLMFPDCSDNRLYPCLLAEQNSLVHDFVARQKVGGTHLRYHVKKQLPNLPPESYREEDLEFIVPRVLELTFTAEELRPWANDLGYDGEPFVFDPDRRAKLRAELDAYFARLYRLNRDELRYILDPADVYGEDYPSETFRGLKSSEIREFGYYRTQKLVLEAWDRLEEEFSPIDDEQVSISDLVE